MVNEYYTKLSSVMNYEDCIIDKESFIEITKQKQEIYVLVEEI